jgi:hypothetical protein
VPGDHDPDDPKTCPACITLDPEAPCVIEFEEGEPEKTYASVRDDREIFTPESIEWPGHG